MVISETLKALNRARDAEIYSDYAIGGAVAAFFYVEPAITEDLGIFVSLKVGAGGLVNPSPIFAYFAAQGYPMAEDKVMIEGRGRADPARKWPL